MVWSLHLAARNHTQCFITRTQWVCGLPISVVQVTYGLCVGMVYEADAVMDCIRAGQTESSEFTQEESLRTMDVCDQVRRQIGVKWPNEK